MLQLSNTLEFRINAPPPSPRKSPNDPENEDENIIFEILQNYRTYRMTNFFLVYFTINVKKKETETLRFKPLPPPPPTTISF